MLVAELTVKNWEKDGNHRLYVNTCSGESIGWVDLKNDRVVLKREELRTDFELALAKYATSSSTTESASPVAADPTNDPSANANTPTLPPPLAVPDAFLLPGLESVPSVIPPATLERPWSDLAHNRPGQGIKELAVAHRQAAPVRTLLARLTGVHTDERAYRVGAVGEEKVARQLARLPDSWHVLHSVPVGTKGSDIDHVIVGPSGVFTVNTKHHPDGNVWVAGDTFLVNGRKQPYVRNARHEAQRATRVLSKLTGIPIAVTGVIAVVGANGGFAVKCQPADGIVHVIGRRHLAGWLLGHGAILTPDDVSTVYEWARRSTTWT
jgi:hypothetical protein